MKNTSLPSDSAIPVVLAHKRKSLCNGSATKRNYSGRNIKSTYEGPRMSRKVHSNINFSKLDEVCLDVGKVDLSYSARLRNDTGLSPQKGFRDTNGELHEVSFRSVNGHADCYATCISNRIELEKVKTIRSCYVQLEALNQPKRRSFGLSPRASSMKHRGIEDEDWKGWSSSIVFSEQHGSPVVRVKEGSIVSEVLVMTEDLADCECKILENNRGYKLKRDNFEKVVLGSCVNSKQMSKSPGERKSELKNKLCELFSDKRELQCFFDGMECSFTSPQRKAISRKLNFCAGNNGVARVSNSVVQSVELEKANAKAYSDNADASEEFIGYTDRAIFTSEKYAKRFLDYCKKIESQNEMFQ